MRDIHMSSHPTRRYLLGLRGFLVIQSFLWVFLQTFVPAAVKDAANASGPSSERILRKSFSILFWDSTLIYSSFIFLSARTICLPFVETHGKTSIVSAIFRRGLRLWFPVAVALAIIKTLSSTIGTAHIAHYRQSTDDNSLEIPYLLPTVLAYFNSVFDLFWTNISVFSQAGNLAFPSQTLWTLTVIYAQGYTVCLTMVIIPYTRSAWRVRAYLAFILSAWWVQSWAWYSITGLLLSDATVNMQYFDKAQRGLKIWRTIRCPVWIPCTMLMIAGVGTQFVWRDWRPQYKDKELLAHAGLKTSFDRDPKEPQARDEDYLLILGFHLLLESCSLLQKIFQNPFFTYLGRRSLSWFLVQSIIIYNAGIKLHIYLSAQEKLTIQVVRGLCFLVCVLIVVVSAEVFYRLVDHPSQMLARIMLHWIRE